MSKTNKLEFSLRKISDISFSYIAVDEIIQELITEKKNIDLKIGLNYKWNLEEDVFAIVINIYCPFKIKDSRGEEEVFAIHYNGMFEYLVIDLKDHLIVRSNNDFDMDETLETVLVSVAISTCRGVFYEKSMNTPYRGLLFPVVNPSELLLSKKFKARNIKS